MSGIKTSVKLGRIEFTFYSDLLKADLQPLLIIFPGVSSSKRLLMAEVCKFWRRSKFPCLFLPDGMIDWFEVVQVEEKPNKCKAQADVLFRSVLNIYLDERDYHKGEQLGLILNGFTEATVIKDYPIRNRKVLLLVRRRRFKVAK